MKQLTFATLPARDRFLRVVGEDGAFYHVVDLALCKQHIDALTDDGYTCKIVPRKSVPPCRCCYFGASLVAYQDASWLRGETVYFGEE